MLLFVYIYKRTQTVQTRHGMVIYAHNETPIRLVPARTYIASASELLELFQHSVARPRRGENRPGVCLLVVLRTGEREHTASGHLRGRSGGAV